MIRNGIDIEQITGFAQVLATHPEHANACLRTRHSWRGNYGVTTHGDTIQVGGDEIPRAHSVTSDRPAAFGGGDQGPAPGELLLAALASCVGGQFIEHATIRGIDVDALDVTCEGRLDLRATFDPTAGRPGLRGVDLHLDVEADTDEATVRELLEEAVRTSPVADSLRAAVPLTPSSVAGPAA